MEEIHVNAEYFKPDNPTPSTNHTGRRTLCFVLILSLGLLSVFLLVGLITLGVYYRDSAERLSTVNNQLSSMTEERNPLIASLSAVNNQLSFVSVERNLLSEKTKELKRLLCLTNQNKSCPAGWRKFNCSCYLLSESSGSWDAARKDCRDREADLVVIESPEEQTLIVTITNERTWIGLNDTEQEGQWKWVDGTPLIFSNWETNEPNNQGAEGGEDCAHLRAVDRRTWNDLPCSLSLKWICEKTP